MRAAVLATIVLACASPTPVDPVCTPGESRACTCSSGASGAQVCDDDGARLGPCECAPGLDASVPVDSGREIDASTTRDAGRDAGPGETDAGRDSGRDGGPPDSGPLECDTAPQSGCGLFMACRMTWTGPDCLPAGEMDDRDTGPCRDSAGLDLCSAGWFCSSFRERCLRYCDPDGAPCPASRDGHPQTCVEGDTNGFRWAYCDPPPR